MRKRILLGCYEVPGHGGASTGAYKLFETMQRDGIDVHYLNIIDKEDADYFQYIWGGEIGNPRDLEDVHNCVLRGALFDSHPELADLVNPLSPDLMVCDGYIAALLMKRAVPGRRAVFLTSGCNQLTSYLAGRWTRRGFSMSKFLQRAKRRGPIFDVREQEAVEICDLIILHSDLIQDLFRAFFSLHDGKMYSKVIWRAEWVYRDVLRYVGHQRPFHERDIDLLFVASRWTRPEKNYGLVEQMVSRSGDLVIHIVGDVPRVSAKAVHHSFLSNQEELYALMGRAKTVVGPSLFDAAPLILFEASAMGCNIVASKNCGNWRICNEQLLVDPFNLGSFLENARLSLERKLADNMDYFLETDSYSDLIEALMVF